MTTIEQHATEREAAVAEVLAAHASMTLATAGTDGPWAGGVYFAELDPFTLVLVLERSGRTLAAIRQNPAVAVVLRDASPMRPFLQGKATAQIVEGDDEREVRERLLAKVPECEPFLQAPVAAVRLAVTGWRITDFARNWFPGKDVSPR
ncbi:pyridoxamine 5'-phosphate oxidase family protein [Amycolatopsis sp. 195334CR]|uniref:pyridoxamine 5'-phosphate oxidase family protein n=1 Tax=Amycolatopsis sp. 195334CR TaxID=2814588 RepID=UPI001A8DF90F|nr:pyridoxamine 5'-phosphate oxidase family protein [Amycolatopsis sp. 195334CR]MBN6040299.1 pyridoxamine 5'-phosphate oxidase family protein [Amycolatopsis sp. 195334CR]